MLHDKKIYQYSQISDQIQITVTPFYLEDESSPSQSKYVWAYQVRIENQSEQTIQLKNRMWMITDALGQTDVVVGEGVVGEQPIFTPGSGYEYTSFVSLKTSSGMMRGKYEMTDQETNKNFSIAIPLFSLDIPGENHLMH